MKLRRMIRGGRLLLSLTEPSGFARSGSCGIGARVLERTGYIKRRVLCVLLAP